MIATIKNIYGSVMLWGENRIHKNPYRASILLMILSGVAFSSGDTVTISIMQSGYHPTQAAFFRGLGGTLFCLPICIAIYQKSKTWGSLIASNKTAMYGRFLCSGFAYLCVSYTLHYITLAEFTVIYFMAPIFLSIAGVLLFKETVGIRRISATVIGFIGVYIVINPQSDGFNIGHIFAIGALIFATAVMIFGKILSREIPTTLNVIYFTFGIMVVGGLLSIPHWQPITMYAILMMLLLGLITHIGQWMLTKSIEIGELSVVMPFEYLRLFYATFYGLVFFGQIPPDSMWIGALLIIGSTLYMGMRERAKTTHQKKGAP